MQLQRSFSAMRYATRGAHPCLNITLHSHLNYLFSILSASAPQREAPDCRSHNRGSGFMETHRNLLRGAFSLAVFLGLLTMYGCAGGWEGSIRVAPSIMRQPSSQSVAAGLTATFTVTATGTGPLSFQWFKGGIAISGANLSSYTTPVTAMSDNGAVFTVAVWNAVGRVTSVPAGLTVTSATLQSIAVTPASPSIAKGLTQQFNATGTYSDGSTQNITTSVTWASATTSVATIGAGTGLATGASVGTSQITATQGSTVSPPATLTVTSATLQSISVTPASPSIAKGLTQQFNATGTYSDGSTQNITTSVTWASATTSVATIGAGTGLATGASVGTSQITATLGTIASLPDTLTVTAAALQSISVTPASPSIAKGLTQQFNATGTYSDGSTQNITTSVTWASATTSVATIGAGTGLATGASVGTSQITATQGSTVSPPATLTVTSATLQSIAVTPASPSIPKGLTQQFNATGTYSDGSTQNITTSVTWASATTSVATIGAGTGLATGASVGTSQITATQGSTVSPPATLTVTSATLQSIAVTPASPSIAKGLTQQFNATGTYSDGSTQNITTSVTWASATTSVATIGAGTGLATGASVGTSQITATLGTIASLPDTLTVTAAALQSISVTPASPSIAKGLTQQFNATGTYSDGSTQNITTSVTWASATTSVATIGAGTGLATGASVGTSQITATLGTIASLPDTLTVTAAALQSISVTPASPSIAKGLTQQFNATGTYSDGSTQNITTSVTWASATTSVATIGAGTGLATGASVGTSQITATLGTIVSLPDTLTVTAAALQSISVTPANPSITVGETQQFVATGTYSDTSTQNITTSVTWASATTSVATIGASTGLATGVAAGTSQITAAQGTVVSLPDTLTVNNTTPLASSLTCTPTNPPYNSTVTLVPTFSGGTGEIGSTGLASTDITAAAISGNSYTTPPVTSAMTYTLTVVGSGGLLALSYPRPMGAAGGGNVASTTCSVTPTSVTISSISPALQTIAPGQQAFTASVSGGATNNVTWSANGGSFNGNIWTSPTTPGNYTITATSVDEPSVSLSTTITISLPVITSQPVSQNACTGGSISLSVTANYAASYQWKLGGVLITGANSASYNVSSASSGDAGSYTVTVTNSAGSVTSNAAQVLVGSTITSNPQSLSIYATQTATFSVSAAGDSPFSYQWYEIPSGGTIGSVISGAVSSSYTTPAVDSSYNATQYYAEVSDSCGSALDSTKATLTVLTGNVPPTITIQPSGVSVAEGDTASFTVVASGTPTLTYQWYRIPAGSLTGTLISGATSASYTVPASATTTSNDQDAYYVIVSNSYRQAVSQHAPLAVGSGILLQITGQPATVYVNAGAPASFTVTASSTLPLTYQWYEAAP